MWKWFKWALIGSAAFVAVAIAVVLIGAPWAVSHFLGRDLRVGEGRLHLKDPRFRWSLSLAADSLVYDAPALRVDAGRVKVSADLFRSLLRFSPSVDLEVDTLRLALRPVADSLRRPKRKAKSDSLVFPDFKLPVSARVHAGAVALSDSAGPRLRITGVTLADAGKRGADLEIKEAGARELGDRTVALNLSVDWSTDSLVAKLRVASGGDSVAADLRSDKRALDFLSAEIRARVATTRAYTASLRGKPPAMTGLDFRARAGRAAQGLSLDFTLQGVLEGLPDSLPLRPGAVRLSARGRFSGAAGTWAVNGTGSKGGDIDLGGNLEVTERDSLANPAWLLRHLAATARGTLRGIPVRVAGREGEATLALERARWAPGAAELSARTGDSTRIEGNFARGKKGWDGRFSLVLAPGEKWIAAFVDTNVTYARLVARGELKEGRLRAVTDASGLRAYGLLADTLHAEHAYGPEGYALGPARLVHAGAAWDLEARLSNKKGKPLTARVSNPQYGSVDFSMPRKTLMEARLRDLFVEKLPYRGLDSLGKNKPRVTADFTWDKAARTGNAKVTARGAFRGEDLTADAEAAWDRERLEVRRADVDFAAGRLRAEGAVKLRGRQFYELKGLGWHDIDRVALEAARFDLAKAMRVFNPDPPVSSGTLEGRFSFGDSLGFRGEYRVRDLQPRSGTVLVKEVKLSGDGDTLRVKAVTVSKQEPLLNDTVNAALTGVLEDVQSVGIDADAGGNLLLSLRGRMRAFKDFSGGLSLRGGAPLPGRSGEIKNLDLRATASLDFKNPLGTLSLKADTLTGKYVVAGIDSQTFSAPLSVANGRLSIPRLALRGGDGSAMEGKVEYNLKGARNLSARLAGGSLVLQLGKDDRFQLRDFEVDVRADSARLTAQASIGSASAEHVKSPLRAAGDLSSVDVLYRAPMGKRGNLGGTGAMPYLQVSAVLDSSELRYRVKSFQVLQDLFKRRPEQRRQAKAVRPVQVRIDLETAGTGNRIDTDILRANYVGNFSMHGVYPYALVQGRINSSSGQLGTKSQAYNINRFEVKWLNSTLEEGEVELEAQKNLAVNCESGTTDSCKVYNRLTGTLAEMRFSYESNCGGAFGAGADVAALIYSVRRGCYSSAFSAGGPGLSVQEQALAMLEPLASEKLSEVAGYLSGHWIAETRVTGLGAFAPAKNKSQPDTGAATKQALAIEVISKEFWRTRLSGRYYYRPQETETANPWAYRVGVEWRPPIFRLIEDPDWKRRIKNNVSVDASIYSDTTGVEEQRKQEGARERVGLNYAYNFWGAWWARPDTLRGAGPGRRRTAGLPRPAFPPSDTAR